MWPDCYRREMNLQLNKKSYDLSKYKRKPAEFGLLLCKINRRIQEYVILLEATPLLPYGGELIFLGLRSILEAISRLPYSLLKHCNAKFMYFQRTCSRKWKVIVRSLNTAVVRVARIKDANLKRLAFHGDDIRYDVFTAVLVVTEVYC